MNTLGILTVLLFHSVAPSGLPDGPARPIIDPVPARPTVLLAQGWRYPYGYGWRPAPTYVSVCEGYECSPHYYAREFPWRPVSLSLSGGFAFSTGADVPTGDSGMAFGLRLGAGLVDRLSLTVALEGTGSQRSGRDESEAAALLGLQWYPLPFFYFRGAVGAGVISYANPGTDASYAGTGSGVLHPVLSAAIGIECGHSDHFAFGLEGVSTWMHVPGEDWNSVQINMVLSFF
jgi:hypothetical protein